MSEALHRWVTLDTVWLDGVEFFRYQCSKCKAITVSGQPLHKPLDKECKVRA